MGLKKVILGLFLLTLISSSWANVRAFLNTTTAIEGDPVTLTIETDSNQTSNPDLSVLNKDFTIQGTGQSSNFSMLNGKTTFTKSWNIQLLPKHKGEINIPAISLGKEVTLPLKLKVTEVSAEVISQNKQHVTLEAQVDIGESLPYVQQQIPYILRLFNDESIISGDLYAPNIDNAVVEKLSRDKQYSVVRNGKKLNVLERHYVISPEKSGKLIIPPAIFKGKQVLPEKNTNQQSRRGGIADNFFNDPFFRDPFFRNPPRGKSITTRSDSIEIDVQPIPTAYQGTSWLPAEDLVISDSWKKSSPRFKVGEPTSRVLTLQTKGLAGSQIPELTIEKPGKIRIYPDKATTSTKTDGKTVFGIRQQQINYIPNEAGKMTIPAVRIDWWNVVTKQQESFTIPAREVEVAAGEEPLSSSGSQGQDTGLAKQQNKVQADTGKEEEELAESSSSLSWLWILLGFGIFGAGLFLVLRKNLPPTQRVVLTSKQDNTNDKTHQRQLRGQLQQACKQNDKQRCAKLLLQLAAMQWVDNPPKSLGALADRVVSGSDLIRALDKSLYAGDLKDPEGNLNTSRQWQGEALWNTFKGGFEPKEKAPETIEKEVAKPLYPDRS